MRAARPDVDDIQLVPYMSVTTRKVVTAIRTVLFAMMALVAADRVLGFGLPAVLGGGLIHEYGIWVCAHDGRGVRLLEHVPHTRALSQRAPIRTLLVCVCMGDGVYTSSRADCGRLVACHASVQCCRRVRRL